jgi:hypothetical protein
MVFSREYLMGLDMATEVLPNYLRIELLGVYTFSELMEQVENFRSAAENAGRNQILIDARLVEGRMTESEKFFVGSRIAEVFGARLKMAVIAPSGNVTKMGEMAAINRGARLFVTECEAEAVEWLDTSPVTKQQA